MARVLIRRPIQESMAEVVACAVTTLLALIGIWFPFSTTAIGHFSEQENRRGESYDGPRVGRGVRAEDTPLARQGSTNSRLSLIPQNIMAGGGNTAYMRARRRVWRHFTACFLSNFVLFLASI